MSSTFSLPSFPRVTLEGGIDYIDKKLAEQSAKLKPFRYDGPVGVNGKWAVEPFIVPKDSLEVLRFVRDGGRGMAPGKYHRLIRNDGTKEKPNRTIVMSDTDAEMIDFLSVVRPFWDGSVLIGGLGMGLAVKTLLMMPDIRAITVVELDPELIELIGPMFAKVACVDIVQGDIFKWTPRRNTVYNWAWFDIWDTISDDNLPDFQKLKRTFRRYVPEKGRMLFWAEKECKLMKKNVSARHWY